MWPFFVVVQDPAVDYRYEVQKLLGHRQVTTTERYAHLSEAKLLEASNHVGTLLGAMWRHRC